ncbi:MAG: glycoside hydrolase family 3 protein [Clostridiales bacterium]|nr:glycoside hydrolase family 3 protein [Clostridiales bacterium]
MRKIKKRRSSFVGKIFLTSVLIVLSALGGGVCSAVYLSRQSSVTPETAAETEGEETAASPADEDVTEDILNSMSLEEKVNQLFFVVPEDLVNEEALTEADERMGAALQAHPVGGIVLFSKNITGEKQLKSLISGCKDYAAKVCRLPLFIGADEEGGTVARLGNSDAIDVPEIPDMSDIGSTGDPSKAYSAGETIGEYLREYGFNLDFAPVADVITNSENQVVKERSFGSDPDVVAEMAVQLAKGLNDKGILACYKHFPGHGATTGDTHEGYAYTDKTYDELLSSELKPFIRAIEEDADFIMAGHISLPNVTGDDTPASLSSVIIDDILKTRLGYEGIVITDSLSMGALTESYSPDEAAVMALMAGADMLLMPDDFQASLNGVLNAVKDGRISEERINESVRKIISKKLDKQ